MIPRITRKELFEMTTKQLYELNNELMLLEEKIKAELILRGDY